MDGRTRAAERRRKGALRQRRARLAETPEQTAERRRKDALAKRRKRAGLRPVKLTALPSLDTSVIDWIESTLKVPTGRLAGRAFKLGKWQRRFIDGALAEGISEAALVVARKNGKSGLVAALILAALCGPANIPRWRGLVVSLNLRTSGELREAIRETVEASGLEDSVSVVRAEARGLRGSRCEFLAADKSSGHASSVNLAVIDELGLMAENRRELVNAVRSSISARDGRMIAISVRGDGPMLGEIIDRADDPAVYVQLHAPPESGDISDPAIWAMGNPGIADGIKSTSYMEAASRRALASPADQAAFRALDLNMVATPARETVVTVSDWVACVTPTPPERAGPCYLGVDLGGSASMTAAAAYWPDTGRLEAWGAFPDMPTLRDRGRADSVGGLYETLAATGEIVTYAGRVTPVGAFLMDCQTRLAGCEIAAILADRFRLAEAQDALAAVGWWIPVTPRGFGFKDGSADVLAFQRAVIAGKVRVSYSRLLESAIADSAIVRDAAGNMKLDKSRARGRIDALSAAVIAIGAGQRAANAPPVESPTWGISIAQPA